MNQLYIAFWIIVLWVAVIRIVNVILIKNGTRIRRRKPR